MREAEQHANGDQNIDSGIQKPRAASVLQFSGTPAICWLWVRGAQGSGVGKAAEGRCQKIPNPLT